MFLFLLLPAAIAVAAIAAFTGRALDRRTDRIYAEHRAMILALRAQYAAWEREQERLAALAFWSQLGKAVGGLADAFRTVARSYVEVLTPAIQATTQSVQAFADGIVEMNRQSGATPRDPRVARHGQFERRR